MSAASDLHPDLQALIGTVIHDRYRVERLLGAGGMGAVFKAHHLGLRRDVALKVLRPELGRDPSTGKRFEREAHSVSRLDHPNCVRVSDFGTTEGGVKYLVMELLDGAELEATLGQPWAPARAVDTIIQILEGLEHAHAVAVVHRDLKPENVFVTKDYRGRELVKLVDFGIAKLIDEQGVKDQLTRAGTIFGTPRYMSPEQASGGKLDERTDLYAAGLILYEMLTGRPPFVADDAAALLRMHILAPPPELPPSVPAPLAAIVNKLLEKSRNDRYASARETIAALQQIRPQLDGAAAAVVTSPVMTGPSATPSMATSLEASTGLSWAPAASGPAPAASGPGASIPSGPMIAPAMPPLPAPAIAVPAVAVSAAVVPVAQPPNAPTHGVVAPGHPSVAITHYDPHPATQPPPPPSRSWTKWAVVGGAIMLALMAFGAGQALNSGGDDDPPRAPTTGESAPLNDETPAASSVPGREFDTDCSDGVCECREQANCEIECGRGCQLRCIDSDRCELEVGSGSTVLCERVGKCEVRCTGDCRVECPQGGCEVTCQSAGKSDKKDDKKDDKREKKRRPKSAKRCGDVYVCGGDCDDDDDD